MYYLNKLEPKLSIKHLSFSSISLWQRCPRNWWAKYIEKSEESIGEAGSFGNDYDRILAKRMGFKFEFDVSKYDEAKKANVRVKCNQDDVNETDELKQGADAYFNTPKTWRYAETYQQKLEVSPAQFEETAGKYDVDATMPYPLLGYIDFTGKVKDTPVLEILDIKTTGRDEFKPEWVVQTGFYAGLIGAVRWNIHLYVRPKNIVKVYNGDVPKELVKEIFTSLAFTANQIKTAVDNNDPHNLPRAVSWGCAFCPLAIKLQNNKPACFMANVKG